MYLLLSHGVGTVGGLLARRRKIPAGAMLGAMLFVVILGLVTRSEHTYPTQVRMAVQLLSGMVIGCRFTRDDLRTLRLMALPAVILIVMLLGINVLFAWIISSLTVLSPITALFAAAPGGVTDLALIAVDFGADTRQVALLQVVRFVFVVSCFPFIVRRLLSADGKVDTTAAPASGPSPGGPEAPRRGGRPPRLPRPAGSGR